jgi:ankyrin repeat protein
MKQLLTTTLVAALLIGCGKKENPPAKNETGGSSTEVKAPAQPKQPTGDLLAAAANGDLQAVQAHIATGSDLNQKDPNGSTPLLIAATFGNAKVCQALIAGGADVNLKNNDGNTALVSAAFMCHPEIVKHLLAKGADPDIKNNTGSTARDSAGLPWAAVKPIYDFLNGLIFKPMGKPVDYDRIQKTRPEIAKILGAVAGAAKPVGNVAKAAVAGDLEALKTLIAAGADVNAQNDKGETPLMEAAAMGQADAAKLLIAAKADVNAKKKDGVTALHGAAFFAHPELVKLLIAGGADVNAKNQKGETAATIAEAPWEVMEPAYKFLRDSFNLPLDLERIKTARPMVAEILRKAGDK